MATEARNVRVYGRLRTAHLERFRHMVPARVLFWTTRYDYDPSEADPANPPVQLSRAGILRDLARHHYDAVDINEPSMCDRWLFLLLQVIAVRFRSAVARKRTTIAAYCMANADPALEVRVRWHLPPRAARLLTTVMMRLLVRSTDRLAFATTASLEMYERYVGADVLRRRARLFEAIPSPCECLATSADTRRPHQVVFVGGLLEHKGVRETMAAWDVLAATDPDARLLLIGKGRLEAEVRSWAEDRPSVTLVVDPPRATIHQALRESAVLVLLSQRAGHWREQIGLPIQEGLGHGCEIVTTTETGLATWLDDHHHSVLPPDAPPAVVAEAIRDALTRARTRSGSLAELPDENQRFAADRWMMAG